MSESASRKTNNKSMLGFSSPFLRDSNDSSTLGESGLRLAGKLQSRGATGGGSP